MKRKFNNTWGIVASIFILIAVSIWGGSYIIERQKMIKEVKERGLDQLNQLHHAAESNNIEVVQRLLNNGADVNAEDVNFDTPLHHAAKSNSSAVARILLNNGADVSTKGSNGGTPLHYAAESNSTAVAQILLDNGADVNALDIDMLVNPLYTAAENNNTEVARTLIYSGADVNDRDRFNWLSYTPLHYAIELKNVELTHLLINYGADLNAEDANGITPLEIASEYESDDPILIAVYSEINSIISSNEYRFQQPGPDPISESEEILAFDLYGLYTENYRGAERKYKGKMLIIYGLVSEIESDYIILKGKEFSSKDGVKCFYNANQNSVVDEMREDQPVSIKGSVEGLFPGWSEVHVHINNCVILN